ncbi:MAG TPA: YqgE/AlgH family protein [Verrucomicrobiales bacterium]|jgi:putative transcriptional regulator|nr:YqgE/AlgH family protein [Verrucomicrobiales bacterium]
MTPDDSSQLCLRGSLILADPSLQDSNFHRTVLLLTEHRHDEGAHGYVLNRPLGKTAGDLLTASEFKPLAKIPVYAGGPVSTEQLTFVALKWEAGSGSLLWTTHLTREDAKQRFENGETVRAFVGYSGWSGGQLESELKRRSWITRKPDRSVLQSHNSGSLWSDLLSSMGPWFHLLSKMPDDPGLN